MRQSIEALEPLFCIYSALKLLNHPFLRPNYQFLIGQGKGGGLYIQLAYSEKIPKRLKTLYIAFHNPKCRNDKNKVCILCLVIRGNKLRFRVLYCLLSVPLKFKKEKNVSPYIS